MMVMTMVMAMMMMMMKKTATTTAQRIDELTMEGKKGNQLKTHRVTL